MPIRMVDIARKIREIRKNLGLTQAEFAEALDASQGSVSKWETGKETPRLESINAIQKLSGLNLSTVRSGREHQFGLQGAVRMITIAGDIQANYGVEKLNWEVDDWFDIDLPIPHDWGPVHLEGRIVKGAPNWLDFPPGSIVIVASDTQPTTDAPEYFGRNATQDVYPEDGDIVVLARRWDDGLYEVVLRQAVLHHPEGVMAFWELERSSDPRTLPIKETALRDGVPAYEFIGVVALVIKPVASGYRLTYTPFD